MGAFRRNKDIFHQPLFQDCGWGIRDSEPENQFGNSVNKSKHGKERVDSVFDDCSWKNNHQLCDGAIKNTSKIDKNLQKQMPNVPSINQDFGCNHGKQMND